MHFRKKSNHSHSAVIDASNKTQLLCIPFSPFGNLPNSFDPQPEIPSPLLTLSQSVLPGGSTPLHPANHCASQGWDQNITLSWFGSRWSTREGGRQRIWSLETSWKTWPLLGERAGGRVYFSTSHSTRSYKSALPGFAKFYPAPAPCLTHQPPNPCPAPNQPLLAQQQPCTS